MRTGLVDLSSSDVTESEIKTCSNNRRQSSMSTIVMMMMPEHLWEKEPYYVHCRSNTTVGRSARDCFNKNPNCNVHVDVNVNSVIRSPCPAVIPNADHYMIATHGSLQHEHDLNTRSASMLNPQFLPNFNDMIKSIAHYKAIDENCSPAAVSTTIDDDDEDDSELNRKFHQCLTLNSEVDVVCNYPQLGICLEGYTPSLPT